MIAPVSLRYPAGDAEMGSLVAELTAAEPLLTAEPWDGETLTLLDGWGRETGIHFLGAPAGQERAALEAAIEAVSRGGGNLSPLGRAQARDLRGSLEIFTTPACPRCAHAVRLAHAMALESRGALTATAVDVTRRVELIRRWNAQTVPFFVVNGQDGFPGPLPELMLTQRIADLIDRREE